ncbi:hypothetical protein BS78_K041300 [Paspalum vaginatum]|uniref:Uncharacterized protein n=1 Tax=Paspalum vaginatum TaxID=158149 RepID=A0A9W8CH45_9POAL|nr:hypothetical protein BS78_K041300 [Paspalum vaginatum]
MPPRKSNTIRSPCKDLTNFAAIDAANFSNDDGTVLSNLQLQIEDPKERRRQRDRERYAQMDPDKKAELLKNRRDDRKKKNIVVTQDSKEHRNQRDRELYVLMDPNKKVELLKRKQDARRKPAVAASLGTQQQEVGESVVCETHNAVTMEGANSHQSPYYTLFI